MMGLSGSDAQSTEPIGEGRLLPMPTVNAAPEVDTFELSTGFRHDPNEKKIFVNPKAEDLWKPIQGPTNPHQAHSLTKIHNNHYMGQVEKANMSHFAFDNQYLSSRNFEQEDRSDWKNVPKRNIDSTDLLATQSVFDRVGKRLKREEREIGGEAAKGKWGGFEDEQDRKEAIAAEAAERQRELDREREEEQALTGEKAEEETKDRVTSIFHGRKETDYQGRSWVQSNVKAEDVPGQAAADELKCYLPKKWIHSYVGHTMGVQTIRWFPRSAHLILSCSMDSTIKIWDYYNQRKCIRTYMGHDQAVRDIKFQTDGLKFYSCSYDKNINLWDTETGQVITSFTNKKTPFCLDIHPDEGQQNVLLAGCSNKKCVQFDSNSGEIVQEYDEHLGAVNTVTFCEEGKKIMTTSDDKKVFIWEYGIPVVTKYIHEEKMHSIPAVTVGPEGKFLLGQAMDNKIICYEARNRFKFQPKRKFSGHLCAGYAIQPNFSPDHHYVMSGDVDGKLWFWDWKTCKNIRTIKAHDGVLIGCMWHPTQKSRVVTCAWDGLIKIWD